MTNLMVPVIIIVLAIALIFAANKQRKKDGFVDYDERQLLIRGNAFQYSFYAVCIYGTLYFLYTRFGGHALMQDGVAVFLGVLLGIAVFAVYSTLSGAQFTKSSPMKAFLIIYGIAILANLLSTGIHIYAHDFVQDGVLTDAIIYPAVALVFLAAFIATLAQGMRDRKAEAGDEDGAEQPGDE